MGYKMSKEGKRAVLVSFYRDDKGTHLRLDDVVQKDGQPKLWEQDVYVTSKPITDEQLDKLDFGEKELADFGHYVLARLRAFLKRGEV